MLKASNDVAKNLAHAARANFVQVAHTFHNLLPISKSPFPPCSVFHYQYQTLTLIQLTDHQ